MRCCCSSQGGGAAAAHSGVVTVQTYKAAIVFNVFCRIPYFIILSPKVEGAPERLVV